MLGRKVLGGTRGVLIARILIVRVLASTCGSGLGWGLLMVLIARILASLGAGGTLGRCTLSGGVGGSSAGGCMLGLC